MTVPDANLEDPVQTPGAEAPRAEPPAPGPSWRLSRPSALFILATGLLYLVIILSLPRGGFWVIDNGVKYLQVRALVDSGYESTVLRWAGEDLDSGMFFQPVPSPFAVVQEVQVNGVPDLELHAVFSPVFALLSSIPYRLFGFPGLSLLPLLSSLLLLAGLDRLAWHLGYGTRTRTFALALVALATPVWFYSVVFWEHVIAVSLCVWALCAALAYLDGGKPLHLGAAAAGVGVAIWFRDELYLLLPVMLAALLLRRRQDGHRDDWVRDALIFGGAAVVVLLPLWSVNLRYTGHVTGLHIGANSAVTNGFLAHVFDRPSVVHHLLTRLCYPVGLSLLLAAPYVVLLLWRPQLERRVFTWAVPVAALAALASFAVTFAGHFGPRGPLYQLYYSNSLFSTSPVLILAMLGFRESLHRQELRRWIWGVMLAYIVLYLLAAPETGSFGYHWGNRFWLVLYPLLGVLAAGTLAEWLRIHGRAHPLPAAALGVVLAASVGAQVYSMDLLERAQDFEKRFNDRVASYPQEVVVTSDISVGMQLHRVFDKKKIFLATKRPVYEELAKLLKDKGVGEALMIETVGVPPLPREGVKQEIVDDRGLKFYAVRLFVRDMQNPERPPDGNNPPASPTPNAPTP